MSVLVFFSSELAETYGVRPISESPVYAESYCEGEKCVFKPCFPSFFDQYVRSRRHTDMRRYLRAGSDRIGGHAVQTEVASYPSPGAATDHIPDALRLNRGCRGAA